MKTSFVKNYKKLLVIWIACGILVSGCFYIFPVYTSTPIVASTYREKVEEEMNGPQYRIEYGKHFEVCVLITIVGAVLIGGLGYTSKAKE